MLLSISTSLVLFSVQILAATVERSVRLKRFSAAKRDFEAVNASSSLGIFGNDTNEDFLTYFENQSAPPGRFLIETQAPALATTTFSFDGVLFNISVSECARKLDRQVGTWTYYNGSTNPTATWRDIILDAQQNRHSFSSLQESWDNATARNNQLLLQTMQGWYSKYVCDYGGLNVHDELRRRLLSTNTKLPNNYWTFLIIGAALSGGVNLAFSTGQDNSGIYSGIQAALAGFVPVFAVGVLGWIAARNIRLISNADRLITAGASAAARQAADNIVAVGQQVLPNSLTGSSDSDCIPDQEIGLAAMNIGFAPSDAAASLTDFASATSQTLSEFSDHECLV